MNTHKTVRLYEAAPPDAARFGYANRIKNNATPETRVLEFDEIAEIMTARTGEKFTPTQIKNIHYNAVQKIKRQLRIAATELGLIGKS